MLPRYAYLTLIACLLVSHSHTNQDSVLRNDALSKIDGIFMNATTIKDMLVLRQALTRLIKRLEELMAQEEQGIDVSVERKAIIQEFEDLTLPFLHQARAMKTFMVQLIDEWVRLYNKQGTLLAAWASITNNNEHEFVRSHMVTTATTHLFLSDLKDFLGVLVKSCPKGYTAFMAKYRATAA